MAVLCFSSLDSFSSSALAEDEFELDLLNPASSHSSIDNTKVAPSRPFKRAKRGHTIKSGMEPELVNKFPTSILFNLQAKDGDVEVPHTNNSVSSSPSAFFNFKITPPFTLSLKVNMAKEIASNS